MNKQVREKISRTLKKRYKEGRLHTKSCTCCICHPELHKSSPRMKGKHQTSETRKKIGIASKKRWKSKKYKQTVAHSISMAKEGVLFTVKHKANLSKNSARARLGKHHTSEAKKTISKKLMGHKGYKMKVKKVRHHIYKEENSDDIMYMTFSKHGSLHKRAYDYIYATQGKKGIDKYIKWFDKIYGLQLKRR